MMRPKKVFKIACFYCYKVFKYVTDFTYMVKRAYCDDCKGAHRHNKWHGKVRLEEYKEYLQLVKNQLGYNKGQNRILLQIRGEQVFKGEISLGRIINQDQKFVYVQKYPFGSICSYRKEFVKN